MFAFRIMISFSKQSNERSTHGKEGTEVPKISAKSSAYSSADRGEDRRTELLAKPIRSVLRRSYTLRGDQKPLRGIAEADYENERPENVRNQTHRPIEGSHRAGDHAQALHFRRIMDRDRRDLRCHEHTQRVLHSHPITRGAGEALLRL